jgi:Cell wall-active antibiotics response 4TMS YvqF
MRLALLALPLALGTTAAQAQTMRPFATFRQMHAETRLAARLEYAAGNLRLGPSETGELYRMDLSYDNDRFVPLSDFDATRGAVVLGLRAAGEAGVRVVSKNQLEQVAAVAFSPRVDLSLDVTLGAVNAEVELGGLRVSSLAVKTGASRSLVQFSRPNLRRCRRAQFSAGAAELTVIGLGNSRCDEIEFDGGMGKVTLDFSGAWTSSSRVQVKMAVGELTLRLPRKVGVRIAMDTFLSSFETVGFVRRGETFQSPNYDRSQQHLDLELTTAMGGVKVEWVD